MDLDNTENEGQKSITSVENLMKENDMECHYQDHYPPGSCSSLVTPIVEADPLAQPFIEKSANCDTILRRRKET